MALTIAYEGTGVVAQAGGATYPNDGVSGASWSNTGGGTSAGYNPDAYVQGTESVGCTYANKDGIVYVTLASTLNFDTGGGAEGEFVYIWMNIQSNGQFDLISATPPGLSIIMGTNATNYRRWAIAGDANDNGWGSGWKCFVIDPSTSGTSTQGTFNLSTINIIGIDINSDTSVRADSIFIDEITVAKGLRVTGTTTASDAWGEIKTWCMDTPGTRRFGFLDEREGVYYVKGGLFVGTNNVATSFVDSGKLVKWETSEYYNGSAWVSSLPSTACGIILEDGADANTTTFTDGVLVGTDNGRSGTTYIGNENENVYFDGSALTNAGSDINLYGTTFSQFNGGITGVDDTDHAYFGVTFQSSGQFDPGGASPIRNCTFAESSTGSTSAALLWNNSIDISDCSFISNVNAIQMVSTTNQDYDALTFSGNTYDTYLTNGGVNIDISKSNGSDPTSYIADGNGGVITYVGAAVTIQVTTQTGTGTPVGSCEIALYAADGTGPFPYQESISISNTGTTATVTHTAHGLSSGDKVVIYGASLRVNNGIHTITVTGTNTYTYTLAQSTGTDPTGTITATFVALAGTSNATTGVLSTSRVYPSAQPVIGWARKSTNSPFYKTAPITGTISSTTGLTSVAIMIPDE